METSQWQHERRCAKGRNALWDVATRCTAGSGRRCPVNSSLMFHSTRSISVVVRICGRAPRVAHRKPDICRWLFPRRRGFQHAGRYFIPPCIKARHQPRKSLRCLARARAETPTKVSSRLRRRRKANPRARYDAIFDWRCGGMPSSTTSGRPALRSPALHFERFDRMVGDSARGLKPGGLLVLHPRPISVFEIRRSPGIAVVYEADPKHWRSGGPVRPQQTG